MKDVADDNNEKYVAGVEENQHADGNRKNYGAHSAAAGPDSFET